ncbi:MAG: T9SS type A sorting domain-containing protein [Cyclobacteriaceae bacterium]
MRIIDRILFHKPNCCLIVVSFILLNSFCYSQSIAHKKVHWTVGADTLKGTTVHTTVLAGQSFIGTSQGTTYTLHAGFFPVKFNHVPTDIIPNTLNTPENNIVGNAVSVLNTEDVFELNDTYTYSLVPGIGDTDNSLFSIAGYQLIANTIFDFETKSNYLVRLQTDDGDYGKFEKAFTIAITDNNDAPDSIMLDVSSMGENAAIGTLIGTSSSRDQDATNTHAYALVAGNGDTDNGLFTIANGQLFTNATYDFETNASHSIRVRTTDNNGGFYDSAMVIQVVDENDFPTDISYAGTDLLLLPENEPIGTVVFNLNTTDQDIADTHIFSLVAGVGDTDNAYFSISGSQVVLADTLNYELNTVKNSRTSNAYDFRLQTSDGNGGTFEEAFSIETYDINDAPYDIQFPTATLRDDKQVDQGVGKFSVLDEDLNGFGQGDHHTFSLPAGVADNSNFQFKDTDTGNLYSNKDFSSSDVGTILTVHVLVRDSLSQVLEKDFHLTVISAGGSTNAAPLWIETVEKQIPDHNVANAPFVHLITEDDAGDTHTYELIAGIGAIHNTYFNVDNDNQLLVATASFVVAADSLFSVRVKSTDNGGLSVEEIVTFTVTPFVDDINPVITNVTALGFIDMDSSVTINATITDNTELNSTSVAVMYKWISEKSSEYKAKLFTSVASDVYTFDIPAANIGEMGIEYYIVAADTSSNQADPNPAQKAFIQFSAANSLVIDEKYLGLGGKAVDWRIFSIPYSLEGSDAFTSIFGSPYGEYDKKKWRLMRWSDKGDGSGEYKDIPSTTNKTELGKGYWFNATEQKSILLDAGTVNTDIPFTLTLLPGFNQIGNPYNIPISWNSVRADPRNSGVLDKMERLQVFTTGTSLQIDGDVMPPFSGGFVFAEESISIIIDPVENGSPSGGRGQNTLSGTDLSKNEWLIPLEIIYEAEPYTVGGFGMHPEASISKDRFDRLAVPRFQAYIETIFNHEDYNYPRFKRDVIPNANEYTWDFTFESNAIYGFTQFVWNAESFGNGLEQLKLFNKESGELINMRTQSSYSFNGGKSLKFAIYFSRDPATLFIPDDLMLGSAYPNPTSGLTVFPVVLPDIRDVYDMEIAIYDIQGRLIKTITNGQYAPGIHEFHSNFNEPKTANGLYIYQLKFNDGFHKPMQKKLVIK